MPIHPRLLRDAIADRLPRRHLTTRELQRRDLILSAGRTAFVRCGRHAITLGSLALVLHLTTAAFRRLFIDLDDLLYQILDQHLLTVARKIAEIPDSDPDHKARRCEAYLDATRGNLGAYTEDHLLLLRERHLLPPDLLAHIESARTAIGEELAGTLHAETTLAVLDIQGSTNAELLRLVRHIGEPAPIAQPEPAPDLAPELAGEPAPARLVPKPPDRLWSEALAPASQPAPTQPATGPSSADDARRARAGPH
jgi:AcrR family transcriptional regulator